MDGPRDDKRNAKILVKLLYEGPPAMVCTYIVQITHKTILNSMGLDNNILMLYHSARVIVISRQTF